MKKNKQGFMLVEALVMTTVVIGVLVFMFIQFRNINRGYDRSFSYNTVPSLHYTNEIKNYLISNNKVADLINSSNSAEKRYIGVDYSSDESWNKLIEKTGIKKIIFADEGLTRIKGEYISEFSEEFNDFINYVPVKKEVNKYRLLVEFTDGTFASLRLGGE